MWKTLSDPVLSLFYPQDCNVCHNEVRSSDDGIACSDCWEATRIFDGSETLCDKCGAFLFSAGGMRAAAFCRRCGEHHYDRATSAGLYERALSASVLHLKRTPHVSRRVKRLFISAFERLCIDAPAVIVPVPLSSRRQRDRGFNQAAILGKIVANHAGIQLDTNSLVRKIHTPMHRAGMDRKARAITVKNAFEVVRPRLIEERAIVLVDDVLTSGETASMCARVLKSNGAATVNVLTLARAA